MFDPQMIRRRATEDRRIALKSTSAGEARIGAEAPGGGARRRSKQHELGSATTLSSSGGDPSPRTGNHERELASHDAVPISAKPPEETLYHGEDAQLDQRDRLPASWNSHYGYGTMLGALFATVHGRV